MDGYKKKLRVFNLGNINVIALCIFFAILILGFAVNLFAVKSPYLATGSVAGDMGLAVGLILVGLVLHEGLHALSAIVFGKAKKSDIRFGVKLKEGLFYCHCKRAITGKAYLIMLLVPVVITGIIPYVVCVFTGGLMQIVAFSMLIAGGAGDVVMAIGLIKNNDVNRQVLDHPDVPSYYALYDEKEIDETFVETTEEEEKLILASPKAKDGKKLGIKVLLIAIFLCLTILGLFLIGLFMELL